MEAFGNTPPFTFSTPSLTLRGGRVGMFGATLRLTGELRALSSPTEAVIQIGLVDIDNTDLTVIVEDGPLPVDLTIESFITNSAPQGPNGLGLIKRGPGTLALANGSTYRPTTVHEGTLIVNGALAQNGQVALQGGVLGGVGSVNAIVSLDEPAPSIIAPGVNGGTSTGRLFTGEIALQSRVTFAVDVRSATLFDQLDVRGTVSLGNATLQLLPSFTPPDREQFAILRNDRTDPIVGTFADLPEGSTVSLGALKRHRPWRSARCTSGRSSTPARGGAWPKGAPAARVPIIVERAMYWDPSGHPARDPVGSTQATA